MVEQEKHIGESKMKDKPIKPLGFKLKDKSVKKNHLSDEVSHELERINDLQNQIDSIQESGNAMSNEFGDDPHIGISQKKLTEDHNERLGVETDLQSQINAIVAGDAQNFSVDPSVVFVGSESNILLAATTTTPASSIKIKKDDTVLATGSGNSLSITDLITLETESNIIYTADFIIAGFPRTIKKNIQSVYPIRIGSWTAYVEGIPLTTPKASPAGTYNITVANNGDYVYINVPATMTIQGATMSGFTFPLEDPEAVTIDGVAYKSYRSSNTYVAGTLTIVIS